MKDVIERRVFGAVEFVDDLSGARVTEGLRISAPGLSLMRNRLGLFVIREAEGHDAYTRAFDPPANPVTREDFVLTVEDALHRYLPQSVTLPLPRLLPLPTLPAIDADNALKPVSVRLIPAAALGVRPAWAVLRLAVVVDGSNPPVGLANVLIEADPEPAGLASRQAMTDRNGEALVVIAGAPSFLPGSGDAGLTREFKVALTLVLDKQVVRRADEKSIPAPDIRKLLARRDASDPDVRVVAPADRVLSAGVTRRHVEKVSWP